MPEKSIDERLGGHETVQNFQNQSGELKPLRIFAKVRSGKIHEYRQVNGNPTLSDEDIAKNLSLRLVEATPILRP